MAKGTKAGVTTALAAVMVAGLSAGRAEAGTVTMTGNLTGTVGTTTYTNQPFTASASFDWSSDTLPAGIPVASYPSSLSLAIGGDTYTADPSDEIDAVIYNGAGSAPGGAPYGVEIDVVSSGEFTEGFNTLTYLPDQQVDVLSDLVYQNNGTNFGEILLPLTSGETLDVTSLDALGATASIYVPEPASLALLSVGLVGTLGLRRRRRDEEGNT